MIGTKAQDLQPTHQDERLPCRGCLATCPYYQLCDGKPWRMTSEVIAPAEPVDAVVVGE